jgi:putative addiction module component (TIGR02574 family)
MHIMARDKQKRASAPPDLAPLEPAAGRQRGCTVRALNRRSRTGNIRIASRGTNMNDKVKALSEAARALAPQDRIALVDDILASLHSADPEIDELWTREALDRLAAYRRGELETIDLDEVLAKYRP